MPKSAFDELDEIKLDLPDAGPPPSAGELLRRLNKLRIANKLHLEAIHLNDKLKTLGIDETTRLEITNAQLARARKLLDQIAD